MIFFGHVGITVGAVQAANVYKSRRADLRIAAVLAVGPDLIDKPLGLLYPRIFENNTRLYAHSIAFSVVVLALLWAMRSKFKDAALLWCAFFGHLILDRSWEFSPEMFFWPFMGEQPAYNGSIIARWEQAFTMPYCLIGETLGISILTYLFFRYRLFNKENLMSFLKTGTLVARR